MSDLAPSGALRAAINVGNPILAARGQAGGEPTGVSVDLARELARRLGVPARLTVFESAGRVVEAGKAGGWDIAFVALDPARASEIAQSPPYVIIEGAYLVRAGSPVASNEQVDRKGNRVVVGRNSAYDLYLTRTFKQAEIVRSPTSPAVVDMMVKDNQAMASQRGKDAGARYVREFIEEMKASGFVARALERHKVQGAGVAPPGDAK